MTPEQAEHWRQIVEEMKRGRVVPFRGAGVMQGDGPLYEELQQLFGKDYPLTSLHRLLAEIPARLREKGSTAGLPLVITTNYDDVLECAFDAANEPFDLVCYFVRREGQR